MLIDGKRIYLNFA